MIAGKRILLKKTTVFGIGVMVMGRHRGKRSNEFAHGRAITKSGAFRIQESLERSGQKRRKSHMKRKEEETAIAQSILG